MKVEPGKQLPQSVTISAGLDGGEKDVTVYYQLYTPENYSADGKPWPLMLFLHGRGESGINELDLVKVHGPPSFVDSRPDFPFIVVAPQCPPPPRDKDEIRAAWKPEQLMQLLDHIEENLNVDSSRIYVTGLSMGGFGTWRLVAAHPERFAAAAPICGGGDPESMAKPLSKVPIWAFHGALDQTVPLSLSEEMVKAVKGAGGDVKLTVYPDVGHNSWKPAYDNEKLYDWLLSHEKSQ